MECLLAGKREKRSGRKAATKIGWIQPFLFDLDVRCVTGYNESCKFGALFEQANGGSRKIVRLPSEQRVRTRFWEEAVVNHGCLWMIAI